MEINEGSDSAAGIITIVNVKGQARLFSSGETYNSVAGTNIIGTGSNATFDFLVASGEITTFDDSSMRFEAPVDMYSSTDSYDRYLVFPRRTIISPVIVQPNPNIAVNWLNNSAQVVEWNNDSDQPVGWKNS
jgi:hypothetical protein